MNNSTMIAALAHAARGWPVFPCSPATKAPLTPNGHKNAATDKDTIIAWWSRWPHAMIGIPTGTASGVWVLDIDKKADVDGEAALARLEEAHGPLAETYTVATPSGGMHLYFRYVQGIGNRGGFEPGIDVRGEGGYVIAAGSVRDDGCFYDPVSDCDIQEATDWLVQIVKRPKPPAGQSPLSNSNSAYVEAAINSELSKLIGTTTGRNNQMNDAGFAIGQFVGAGVLTDVEAEERLIGAAMANGYIRKDGRAEALATIRSGLEAGKRQPRDIPESHIDDLPAPDPSFSVKDWIARLLGRKAKKGSGVTASIFAPRDAADIPRRASLYAYHLFRKFVSSTVGAGGGGKSSHAIVETLSMVSGLALLGPAPPEPLSVWYVNLEDPLDEIERRFVAAAKHHGIDLNTLRGRLFVDSGRDQEFVVLRNEGKGTRVVEPVVKSMIAEMIANQIDVLIVDPFISTHEVEENDNSKIQQVAKQFVRIADEANAAVELVHHVSKGSGDGKGEVTADSARGASALKDKARSVRTINGMTVEEAKKAGIDTNERFSYFRINSGKANLAKRTGHSEWRRLVSVDVGNGTKWTPGDSVGVVERWEWPTETSDVDEITPDQLNEIRRRIAGACYAKNFQSDDWAGKVFADVLGLDAKEDRAKIVRMMTGAIKKEQFVVNKRYDREKARERPMFEVAPIPHRDSGGVGTTVH
ncbi:bifunctional DNA primase/polymerase [Bradyrhizobium sp. 62]|uniref:bifunctional DNA primase/polymerase n=1 Tax=Bradyrhizobium sp. 62 TaxID=1043588 RepID=UPI001FF85D32|nr:bifunctional DNA primase/polymerase [Bradyrhizobium sp. 62]MCK1367232.1 bifunctional DNA primase/polymerase [Bradyrhizobium sp. 62]